MPDTIRDGGGSGYLAKVNTDGELRTSSRSCDQRLHSALDNNYNEATTAKVTLANANETGLIYIENGHSEKDLVIDRVFWDTWTSTGGSGGDGTLRYYRNPAYTGGTTITPNNTNFTAAVGAEGTFLRSLATITGTVWWTGYITDQSSIALEEGRIALPPGAGFGISIAAPTGNTNMDIVINVAFYYIDSTLIVGV